MARTRSSLAVSTALVFALIGAPSALAQPAGSSARPSAPAAKDAPAPAEDTAKTEQDKEEARAHFDKGLALMDQRAFAPALAEFRVSLRRYPTRNATFHAASCLRSLQRFDEALEMFETLLREFPKLPQQDKTEAQGALDELRGLVGTIEVTGAKLGASIVIDGRNRGDYPPVNPIRVAAGTHTVRIFKEGYAPFETRVEVAGSQTVNVSAKLLVLTDAGGLKVSEQGGKVVDVLVDGVIVGQTPWEGTLSAGDHMVVLRGEGSLGTAPVATSVKARELSTLSLRAEELEATLRVDPIPAGASVTIDAVPVGRGTWEGALRSGAHQVEVRSEGFVRVSKQITLARGQQEQLSIPLERDQDADVWKKPSKIMFDASTGFMLVPSFGGDVVGGCASGCSSSLGLGGLGLFHGGYERGSGLGIGAMVGYLIAVQRTQGRASSIKPVGLDPNPGTVDDQLRLSAFVAGATVGYRIGENYPVLLRLGGGVVLGSVRDKRSGRFKAEGTTMELKTDPVADSPSAAYGFFAPEVRISKPLGERFELGAGVQGLLLLAFSQPKFSNKLELRAPKAGIGTYWQRDALTGPIVFSVVPGVSARYAF